MASRAGLASMKMVAALLLAATVGVPAGAQTAPGAAPAGSWIAADFAVPALVEGPGFKLVPLGPALVDVDYQAYMSSIAHLQQTFTRSTSWPREGITAEEAMLDMQTEQGRFERRESFAYAVLTPDGSRERGCVYVYPSKVGGHDAEVRLWVTQAEYDAGFDAELYTWTQQWIARDWPFRNVAYPGRAIAWDKWDAMVMAARGD
ncbi:twin-arginine translocation pathway signal protein [Erythrobacter dokdonensis]|uniref:Twin-arginine translocation pathway signal protein n=1 Tax=Erythrobacter dokdonensis DSW-74 TaxID=1300349 RepID=A0A1A7BGE0_9SPHN|nr:twin-arginine translocation pathway signal protein [Erythrobacter dokdonensis]OBV10801.1 twin-arginine translocation pathway signal protein [Erythrobacter dokdonensis DSW-74]